MYKSRESHLQYVPPSLILLPSGSCSETNSHRRGHICQQHRACVIHRYGELKRFSLSRSPPVTHTHTPLSTHLSDISITIQECCHFSRCTGRSCGPPQLFRCRRQPGKTGVDALLTSCGSAQIKQMSEFKNPE